MIPLPDEIIEQYKISTGITSPGKASIREIVQLVNRIEAATGVRFIRMEMGEPGLTSPSIAVEAEISALKNGVSSVYPNISGIAALKEETSRFIRLFLNAGINPEGCIPTVGSMMGSMISFLVANRNDKTK